MQKNGGYLYMVPPFYIQCLRLSYFFKVISLASFLNDLIKEMMTKINMIENGNATMIEAVCSASRPPCHKRTAAAPDCKIPQMSFTELGGNRLPPVVCIPNTKVAESADVMKNVLISSIPINDRIVPYGI